MMQAIQAEYDYPVDTEFTINLSDDGEYLINLLQCRPLQVLNDEAKISIPENIGDGNIFLENKGVARKGYECIYNVLIMEEKLDTFAAGAGAITRLLNIEDGIINRIDRVENCKNVDEYISRLDEMLERKQLGVDSRIISI